VVGAPAKTTTLEKTPLYKKPAVLSVGHKTAAWFYDALLKRYRSMS